MSRAQVAWLSALLLFAGGATSSVVRAAPSSGDDGASGGERTAEGEEMTTSEIEEVEASEPGAGEGQEELAQRLFREGEEAYWLGDFDRAVERFEEAYKLSKLPGMLYNVGLAYQRRHGVSKAPADLKRARAVFVNYLDADTTRLIDPRHVERLIAEIDAELAVVETKREEQSAPVEHEISTASDEEASCPDPALATPTTIDTGRRSRLIGGGLMGLGGLLLSGGAVSLTVFSLKGREFEAVLAGIEGEQSAAGCGTTKSALCDDLARSAEITVGNGYRANVLAGAVGGSLIAAGIGGLVTGALLYRRGAGERPRRAEVAVTPTLGGAAIFGRF